MIASLRDPAYCVERKEKSRKWAVQHYSYESVARRMEGFYEYLLRGDDPYWYESFSSLYQETARKDNKVYDFVNPQKVRW
jgi:hypothetical protein